MTRVSACVRDDLRSRVRVGLATAIATSLAVAAPAAAAPGLEEYGAHRPRRDASEVVETDCAVDVAIVGGIATVELRRKLKNVGAEPLAAVASTPLPRGAVVTAFAVGGQPGVRASAGARTELVDNPDVLGADPAWLAVDDDAAIATLQPIEPGREVPLALTYAVRVGVQGSALALVLPGLDDHGGGTPATAGRAAACRGTVRATPGPGATIDRIRVGASAEDARPGRGPVAFALGEAAVPIAVELTFGRDEPLAWTQQAEVGGGYRATIATVLAPPVRAAIPAARRVLFVIDGSRSMELVGRANVARVVHAVAAALPADAPIEAVTFDRTAARVFGGWRANGSDAAALERAIATRPSGNGTALADALRLARAALVEPAPGATIAPPATVVIVTDAMLPDGDARALAEALAPPGVAAAERLDVHVIALEPARTHAPAARATGGLVAAFGGSSTEVSVDELDAALASADAWLRPAWVGVALGAGASQIAVPDQLVSGGGVSAGQLERGRPAHAWTLAARTTDANGRAIAVAVPARPVIDAASARGVVELALADPELARAIVDAKVRDTVARAHPFASRERGFAVLATRGTIAASRRAMIAGGGSYVRSIAIADQPPRDGGLVGSAKPGTPTTSAIARIALERMFREQLQPRVFACYQRALPHTPALAGTVDFTLHVARGEITRATATALGEPTFDACVLDAAYSLAPPIPDFSIHADDETVVRYPLVFKLADRAPAVVHDGDADSEHPIDIDAVEGGVPTPGEPRRPVHVDSTTPLGPLRPH